MPARVEIAWDDAALRSWAEHGAEPHLALEYAAGLVQQEMKRLCPVSPVMPTYAAPVPEGYSHGQVYQVTGKGVAWPGGSPVLRRRLAGDLPLRPSGYLRNSITREWAEDGSVLIGPTAPYGAYVNDGTPPHGIDSTGPWPLRNRASGQVFGRHVNHPGTQPTHFVEKSVEVLAGVVMDL